MDTGLPTVGHVIWRWLEFYDLDAERLFARQDLSRADLQSHSARVPSEKWEAIASDAKDQFDDECAGLNAARCWHPSDLGTLGYAWLASSTLRTGFHRMARYMKVVGERGSLSTQDTSLGFQAVFQQNRPDPVMRELIADFALSLMVDMARVNFGSALVPVEVTLQRQRPDCWKKYPNFYGCEVKFSAPEDSFTLNSMDVDRPLPSANKQLAGVHDRILMQQLAALDREDIVARCQAIILENLTTGATSTQRIARELHMSPRTLTRRLESKGTQLQQIIDDTRRALAERYFADPENSLSEVAFLLGFAQQSSLTRASNRWFGLPPKKYRAVQLNQSASSA
jgi:AraC-like DNA-binding protein